MHLFSRRRAQAAEDRSSGGALSPTPNTLHRTRVGRSNSDVTGKRPPRRPPRPDADGRQSSIPLGFDLMFGASHPRTGRKYSPVSPVSPLSPTISSYSLERANSAGTQASAMSSNRAAPVRQTSELLPPAPGLRLTPPQSPSIGGSQYSNSNRGLGLHAAPKLLPALDTTGAVHVRDHSLSSINTSNTSYTSTDPANLREQVQRLQAMNRDLESELTDRIQRFNGLRQSHAAVVESLKESQEQELAALQKTIQAQNAEIAALQKAAQSRPRPRVDTDAGDRLRRMEVAMREKDADLDAVRTANESLRNRIASLENSGELGELRRMLAEETRRREAADKIATAKAHAEMELKLQEERNKMAAAAAANAPLPPPPDSIPRQRHEKEIQYIRDENEKRIQDLNWMYNTNLERSEEIRKEQDSIIEGLLHEKADLSDRLQSMTEELHRRQQQQSHPPKTPASPQSPDEIRNVNEQLVEMVKKITTRLAEEKKKNRQLEATVNSMTETSLSSVSNAQHEMQKMKSTLEDRTTDLERISTELKAAQKERNEFRDAWNQACDELAELQTSLDEKMAYIGKLEKQVQTLQDDVRRLQQQLENKQHQIQDQHHQHQLEMQQQEYEFHRQRESDLSNSNNITITTTAAANEPHPVSPPPRDPRRIGAGGITGRGRALSSASAESDILPPDLDSHAFSSPPSPTSSNPTTISPSGSADLAAMRRDPKPYRHLDIKPYQREPQVDQLRQATQDLEQQIQRSKKEQDEEASRRGQQEQALGGESGLSSPPPPGPAPQPYPQPQQHQQAQHNSYQHYQPRKQSLHQHQYPQLPQSPTNPSHSSSVEVAYREMSLPPVPPTNTSSFHPPNIGHFLPPPRDPLAVSGPTPSPLIPGRSTPTSPPLRSATPLSGIIPLALGKRAGSGRRRKESISSAGSSSTGMGSGDGAGAGAGMAPVTPTLTAVTPISPIITTRYAASPPPMHQRNGSVGSGVTSPDRTSVLSGSTITTTVTANSPLLPGAPSASTEKMKKKVQKESQSIREFREGFLGELGGGGGGGGGSGHRRRRSSSGVSAGGKGKTPVSPTAGGGSKDKERVITVEEMMNGLEREVAEEEEEHQTGWGAAGFQRHGVGLGVEGAAAAYKPWRREEAETRGEKRGGSDESNGGGGGSGGVGGGAAGDNVLFRWV